VNGNTVVVMIKCLHLSILVTCKTDSVMRYCVAYGRNFVGKCGGVSVGWNQNVHPVDAEVKFYKYRFLILFSEVFENNTNHTLL